MKTVIVSAAEFEAEPTREALSQHGIDSLTILTGVGPLNAAKTSQRLALVCKGAEVLFIGTCGTFGSFSEPFNVTAKRIEWLPTAARTGAGYVVQGSAPGIEIKDGAKDPRAQTLIPKTVLCSGTISQVASLPQTYDPEDCVENLELYSCVEEILAAANSLTVVLTVTNAIGPSAHEQWQANWNQAAHMAAAYVRESWRPRGL